MSSKISQLKCGSLVNITMDDSVKYKGDVVYHDPVTGFLFIQQSSKSGKPDHMDVIMVQSSFITELEVLQEGNSSFVFKQLNFDKIDKRFEQSHKILQDNIKNLNLNVSQEAQQLYSFIHKTITDVSWSGKDIIVMDSVNITQPYKPENVTIIGISNKQANDTAEMVKKMVNRFYETHSQMSAS